MGGGKGGGCTRPWFVPRILRLLASNGNIKVVIFRDVQFRDSKTLMYLAMRACEALRLNERRNPHCSLPEIRGNSVRENRT